MGKKRDLIKMNDYTVDTEIKPDRCLVFFDFTVDEEFVGRIIIELFTDIVPRTAENFRGLCTGEYGIGKFGKSLHYKNSIIHKSVAQFMIQGGDIITDDGKSGESIYGPFFEDENFIMNHDSAGLVAMANKGVPDTNSSQFFISVAPCSHLDGKHVVVGKVVRGYNVVKEISETETVDDKPNVKYVIGNCGQIDPKGNLGLNESDGTADEYPPWPGDWDIKKENLKPDEFFKVVENIKQSGNYHYKHQRYSVAERKYNKSMHYLNWYKNEDRSPYDTNVPDSERMMNFRMSCILNIVATLLKCKNYRDCISACNQVLEKDAKNVKATFRKGVAYIGLNDQEIGLECLRRAHRLAPKDRAILVELDNVKRQMRDYLHREKSMCVKMLKGYK